LEFSAALNLVAGEFVLLDSSTRTAYRNGDRAQPVLSSLNFSTSAWWQIQPGLNIIRYYPFSAGAGALAQISFRAAWPM